MRQMRKRSRCKSPEWALDVFDKAPYVTLSMARSPIRSAVIDCTA